MLLPDQPAGAVRAADTPAEDERAAAGPGLDPRYSPAALALWTSRGKWRLAPHLRLLDRAVRQAIVDAEAGTLDGLTVSMPPQHGKSELCSRYLPAWYLGTRPDRRVILVGYEADFAAHWGRRARDLLAEHGELFGVRVARESSAAQRWDLEGRDGGMSTAGVGGPITGKGAHLLIIDDPVKNDEEARSPTCRRKAWEWWQSVAGTRLRPGGLTVVIQTRWHREDLTGRLLEMARDAGRRWRQVRLPALAEPPDALLRPREEALWPATYSRARLEGLRAARTNYYWQALYQQHPTPDGAVEWGDEYFGPEIWFDDWPIERDCRVVALDPSKGHDAKTGDESAFVLLHVGPEGIGWVDADLGHWNSAELVDRALQLQKSFQPDGFAVEINQFQHLLAERLHEASSEKNVWVRVAPFENRINKLVRIRGLTGLIVRGKLRFRANSPGARRLVQQLRDFPCGDHDDGPDALEMAVRHAQDLMRLPTDPSGGVWFPV